MDNSIIEKILTEWALQSADGLVAGHTTDENIKTLKFVLTESLKMSEADASIIITNILSKS
jgi:hypothetical protein